MSANFIALYVATVFVASIIPGPSMLLALTHGMQYGARKTMASAMGNVGVTFLQALVSAAGLGTVLAASETLFQAIKWAGAAYLVYMGFSMLLAPALVTPPDQLKHAGNEKTRRKMAFQAAMVTAGNPKAIVFFTAIFPQFINPGSAYLVQSAVLLSLGCLIAFVCFMIYASAGQKIVAWLSGARVGVWVKNLIGSGFIGSGIGLAFSRR